MTSSREHTSAEAEGYTARSEEGRAVVLIGSHTGAGHANNGQTITPHREGTDGLRRPPSIHQCPPAESWLLRGIFDHWPSRRQGISAVALACRKGLAEPREGGAVHGWQDVVNVVGSRRHQREHTDE